LDWIVQKNTTWDMSAQLQIFPKQGPKTFLKIIWFNTILVCTNCLMWMTVIFTVKEHLHLWKVSTQRVVLKSCAEKTSLTYCCYTIYCCFLQFQSLTFGSGAVSVSSKQLILLLNSSQLLSADKHVTNLYSHKILLSYV